MNEKSLLAGDFGLQNIENLCELRGVGFRGRFIHRVALSLIENDVINFAALPRIEFCFPDRAVHEANRFLPRQPFARRRAVERVVHNNDRLFYMLIEVIGEVGPEGAEKIRWTEDRVGQAVALAVEVIEQLRVAFGGGARAHGVRGMALPDNEKGNGVLWAGFLDLAGGIGHEDAADIEGFGLLFLLRAPVFPIGGPAEAQRGEGEYEEDDGSVMRGGHCLKIICQTFLLI